MASRQESGSCPQNCDALVIQLTDSSCEGLQMMLNLPGGKDATLKFQALGEVSRTWEGVPKL